MAWSVSSVYFTDVSNLQQIFDVIGLTETKIKNDSRLISEVGG